MTRQDVVEDKQWAVREYIALMELPGVDQFSKKYALMYVLILRHRVLG